MQRESVRVPSCGSLTASAHRGDHRRAASARRRATLLITASLTASLATPFGVAHAEDLESRQLRSAAVPRLQLAAALGRYQTPAAVWSGEAFAWLSWPLDGLRHVPRNTAPQRSRYREHLVERMAELWQRRDALRARAADVQRQLDLEENDAELGALGDEVQP